MLEHFKGDELFVKKVQDYIHQAEQGKLVLTPFLNPHEVDVLKKVVGNRLQVVTYGGLVGAESNRVIICEDYYTISDEDFEIVICEVIYNRTFASLQHKDVLGALMHLGIARELIGDIYEDHGHLYFVTNTKTYSFIKNEMKKIKKASITLNEVDETIEIQRDYIKRVVFVSSLRLDKVVASLYNVSREISANAIRGQKIKVNHAYISQIDYQTKSDDLISFSKHGRVKVEVTSNTSKSGNIVLVGYYYK